MAEFIPPKLLQVWQVELLRDEFAFGSSQNAFQSYHHYMMAQNVPYFHKRLTAFNEAIHKKGAGEDTSIFNDMSKVHITGDRERRKATIAALELDA